MNRRILISLATMVCVALVFSACKDDDAKKNAFKLTSKIDVSGSSVSADKFNAVIYYSTDNGATFSQFPSMTTGQTFQAKVWDPTIGKFLTSDYLMSLDWSGSSPAPSSTTADAPTFTLNGDTKIVVTITGTLHCPFDAASWTGDWTGAEGPLKQNGTSVGNGSNDAVTITQDPTNPNKLWISNFFGDGPTVLVYMLMNPSTTAFDQTITVPLQTSSEGADASGTGTYDQCAGTLSIAVKYDIYSWTYVFTR